MDDAQDLIFRFSILVPGLVLYAIAVLNGKKHLPAQFIAWGVYIVVAMLYISTFTGYLVIGVLGFFMLLPNTMLYGLVMTPGLLVWRTGRRITGGALLAASLLAFATIPPILSNKAAEKGYAAVLPPEPGIDTALPQRPRNLNFITVNDNAGYWYPHCDSLCERLLKSGLVDRVRIGYTSPDKSQSKSLTFLLNKGGGECPYSICNVSEKDDTSTAYLAISHQRFYIGAPNVADDMAERYDIYDMSQSPPRLLQREVDANAWVLESPLMLDENTRLRRRVIRFSTWKNALGINFDSILIQKLGFSEDMIYGR